MTKTKKKQVNFFIARGKPEAGDFFCPMDRLTQEITAS